jgi:hypothetical protein
MGLLQNYLGLELSYKDGHDLPLLGATSGAPAGIGPKFRPNLAVDAAISQMVRFGID